MDKEKMIAQIMKECADDGEPVTREEAEEMAEMEIKAKGFSAYTTTEKLHKKATKPRKVNVSDEKQLLFETILANLDRCEGVERENIEILNKNKLIGVQIGTKHFKIDITEQRKSKK